MTYEQKYENALERAKIVYHDHRKDRYWRDWLIELFPELKENESEDENIRQAIIAYINHGQHCGVSNRDMIAWLEKQSNKSVNIDVESMVSSYEQRLKSQGCINNNPLGNMCLTAFRHGVENALEELNLKKFEKQNKILNVELLTKVLIKHLYTCVNKTNTYVRSEEDNITLTEFIAKIKTDLNIE